MIYIYNLILTFVLIIFFPLILAKYKFDDFEKINKKYKVWVHCASVGELKMALRLVNLLIEKLKITSQEIILTTTNLTAKNIAKNVHKDTFIFPIDYYFITRKFVKRFSHKLLIILETELWPNYIYFVKKYGGKIFLLNGRITKNTFVLLKMFKYLFSFGFKNINYCLVREPIDYLRFKNIGIDEKRLFITGNMKYDDIDDEKTFEITREHLGFKKDDVILIFGSIRENEERVIIEQIKQMEKIVNLKFILAPRHLLLVPKIINLLKKNNIPFVCRSKLSNSITPNSVTCLVIDTLGELKKFYSVSDIAFVCGTILPYGGQSVIEPASLGKVVMFGPYISNFLEPATMLLKNHAAILVKEFHNLPEYVNDLIKNKEKMLVYGIKAKEVVHLLKGSTEKNVNFIISKFTLTT